MIQLASKPLFTFVLGAVSTIVIPKVIRPLLVGTVSAALSAKEFSQTVWSDGVEEAKKIREEAIEGREKTLEREIHDLRSELKDLKK